MPAASTGPVAVTDSGPAKPPATTDDAASRKMAETGSLAEAMPFNASKAAEHGLEAGRNPPAGQSVTPPSRLPTAGTLSESNVSAKTDGVAPEGGSHDDASA